MKMFTHAWLAFMAIQRLDKANIPETYDDGKKIVPLAANARSLVRWFKNYRDYVMQGAWYPDLVFADMGKSHGVKYRPDPENTTPPKFKILPDTMEVYNAMKATSPLYHVPFKIVKGDLCDRCEAMAHTLVDNFKIMDSEDKGNPLPTTSNHMAMRFFILSHYVADAHMPLHCDARSLSKIHAEVEKKWEEAVNASYEIDKKNYRFYYDSFGYPLKKEETFSPLLQEVEKKILERPFDYSWGENNTSTWYYMSTITEYSYMMAYHMFPEGFNLETFKKYKDTEEGKHFDENCSMLLADAVDSIARVWLHAWSRYRRWVKTLPNPSL
jgi:hypothetical protein